MCRSLDELVVSALDEGVVNEENNGDEDKSACDRASEDLGSVTVVRRLKLRCRVEVLWD